MVKFEILAEINKLVGSADKNCFSFCITHSVVLMKWPDMAGVLCEFYYQLLDLSLYCYIGGKD
jgi:hypothetical protein